ncbi:MAG: Sec-independent protein translocase protein TatB [bacterium]
MFDVGFWEVALISIVALVIIGPERLPAAARTAGLWIGKARRALREVKADINRELQAQDLADLNELKNDLQAAGDEVKAAAEQVGESAKQSGAQQAAEEMQEAFKQASPLRDVDGDADEEVVGKESNSANQQANGETEKESESAQSENGKTEKESESAQSESPQPESPQQNAAQNASETTAKKKATDASSGLG